MVGREAGEGITESRTCRPRPAPAPRPAPLKVQRRTPNPGRRDGREQHGRQKPTPTRQKQGPRPHGMSPYTKKTGWLCDPHRNPSEWSTETLRRQTHLRVGLEPGAFQSALDRGVLPNCAELAQGWGHCRMGQPGRWQLGKHRWTGHTQAARLRAHDLHVRVCVGMATLSTPVSLGHFLYNVGGRGKDGPSCH